MCVEYSNQFYMFFFTVILYWPIFCYSTFHFCWYKKQNIYNCITSKPRSIRNTLLNTCYSHKCMCYDSNYKVPWVLHSHWHVSCFILICYWFCIYNYMKYILPMFWFYFICYLTKCFDIYVLLFQDDKFFEIRHYNFH